MTDLQSQLQSTLSGAYTIERELGGGGMSRVFVADEIRLGRKVVVKVLSPELWKKADPELQPSVTDATKRLAKLQAGGKS